MDAEMQTVIAEMRAGFNALNLRVTELKEDTREDAQQMHRENKELAREQKERLMRIEDQCRITNGRVSTLESEVRNVWVRIKELAWRRNSKTGEAEPQGVTLGDLKWYLVCFGAGGSLMLAFMKMLGKI